MESSSRLQVMTKSIRLWKPAGQPIRTMQTGETIVSTAWSLDGKTLAVAVQALMNKGVQLWDIASGRLLDTVGDMQTVVTSVEWSPDGRTLALGGFALNGGRLLLFNAAGNLIRMNNLPGRVTSVAWSPDGNTLAVATDDLIIRLWNPTFDGERIPRNGRAPLGRCTSD